MGDESEGKPISQGPHRDNNDGDVANSRNEKNSDAVPTVVNVTQTIENPQSAEKKPPNPIVIAMTGGIFCSWG